jgi:hypothetical protein
MIARDKARIMNEKEKEELKTRDVFPKLLQEDVISLSGDSSILESFAKWIYCLTQVEPKSRLDLLLSFEGGDTSLAFR